MGRLRISALIFLSAAVGCQGEMFGPLGDWGNTGRGGGGGDDEETSTANQEQISSAGGSETGGKTNAPRGSGGSAEQGGDDTNAPAPDGAGGESGTAGETGVTTGRGGAAGRSAGGLGGAGGRNVTSSGGGGAGAGGAAGTKTSGSTAGAAGAGGSVGRGGSTSSSNSTTCTGHAGPAYEDFFDNKKLATFRITFDQTDFQGTKWLDALWAKWTHCPPFNNYVPVKFQYESADGTASPACDKVGMRIRGSWPKDTWDVAGFKLDMQKLDTSSTTEKRRFADLNRINVLSIEGDKSHMIQCLAYKVFRDYGLPAPLCNHVKVYVNNTFYALLENVEQINGGFLRRHFGSNEGNLYGASPSQSDCTGTDKFDDSAARLTYNGDSYSSYANQYQLTRATASDAEQNLIPMLKCGDATQTASDADFKKCISEWIDVGEWLKEIAAEALTPALESWIGYNRNYYLYFKPDETAPHKGRFVVWSWDSDSAFQRQKCYPTSCDPLTSVSSFYGPRNGRSKFVTRLTTVFRTEYCSAMKSFLTSYNPKVVDDMAAVLETGIQNDKTVTAQEWQTDVSAIRTHMTNFRTTMQTQVNSACP